MKNVIVLSGDIHSHWAADIPLHMNSPDGPSAAVELTCTSISSGGDGSAVVPFYSAIRPTHPHVGYHSNHRGYLKCTVSPAHWTSDFMTLDSVSTPDGQRMHGGRIVVEPGNPVAIQA